MESRGWSELTPRRGLARHVLTYLFIYQLQIQVGQLGARLSRTGIQRDELHLLGRGVLRAQEAASSTPGPGGPTSSPAEALHLFH